VIGPSLITSTIVNIKEEGKCLWTTQTNLQITYMGKMDLHMTIMVNMITCCLIHDLLLARNEIDIEHMLHILEE
jgi:hypothetical protein